MCTCQVNSEDPTMIMRTALLEAVVSRSVCGARATARVCVFSCKNAQDVSPSTTVLEVLSGCLITSAFITCTEYLLTGKGVGYDGGAYPALALRCSQAFLALPAAGLKHR